MRRIRPNEIIPILFLLAATAVSILLIDHLKTQPEEIPLLQEPAAAVLPEQTEPPETLPPVTVPETETEPEPVPEHFLLTFAGDCTLGCDPNQYYNQYGLVKTVGEDYDYPFRSVSVFFRDDDFTMVNLEGVLADDGIASGAMFPFRGPSAFTQILTGSSVEAVTIANNHAMDYHAKGYEDTKANLDSAGVAYVERDSSMMYTTESGLTIGVYGALFSIDQKHLASEVARMRQEGAELIILAVHWGIEGAYRPFADQMTAAYTAIDAGVDIVYGTHPHVLQKIETYGDGIIYYSLGNFCFGGNNYPPDLDSVILRQEVIREPDGTVHLGFLDRIPVSCSSLPVRNDFQPTPCDEDSDMYRRVLSKLDGSWTGPNLAVNYN